ncbi:hypothetical protein HBB04_02396 [Pseudomonas coronafaciens]|nr:hypothetical protein HBB04_02396 [Pseudomonas coronafaciens]
MAITSPRHDLDDMVHLLRTIFSGTANQRQIVGVTHFSPMCRSNKSEAGLVYVDSVHVITPSMIRNLRMSYFLTLEEKATPLVNYRICKIRTSNT